MITLEVDLPFETEADEGGSEREFTKGEDVTELAPEYLGITPDKLIVVHPEGAGGGSPVCHASFSDEKKARQWFTEHEGDDDPEFFDSYVV